MKDVFLYGGDRWFVYVLMGIFTVSLPLRMLAKTGWILVVITMAVVMTLILDLPRLFLIEEIVRYIPFFLIGMFVNSHYSKYKSGSIKFFWAIVIVFVLMNVAFVVSLKEIGIMKELILPLIGTAFFMDMAYMIEKWCAGAERQPYTLRYLAYCGKYSLQFYLFTFAYPIIRYVVVSVLHITAPLPVFLLVFVMQLIVMTVIIESTRRIKWLKVVMGY